MAFSSPNTRCGRRNAGHGAVLQLDPCGFFHDVVVPDRIFGVSPSEATIAYWVVVLDAHQRGLGASAGLQPPTVSRMTGFPAAVPSVPPDFIYVSAVARPVGGFPAYYSSKAASTHLNGG